MGRWDWYKDPETGETRDWYCEDVLTGRLQIRKVFEDDLVLAFHHRDPEADVHVVVVPKDHVPSLMNEQALNGSLLISMVRAVQEVAHRTGLDKTGFHMEANAASPHVTPHMHWHVKSGLA